MYRSQYSEWTVGPLSSVTCALCLCSLLAAISQFRVSIGQKMQLTGYENANNMRNAKCAGTQTFFFLINSPKLRYIDHKIDNIYNSI